MDHQVSLPADHSPWLATADQWRLALSVLGSFLAHGCWIARHLVSELSYALWGSRRLATRDDSTNNWFVALLTFGEGWHNNHHAHPTSARHGLRWYEVDMNWYGIWMLNVFGLAKQVQLAHVSDSQSQPNSRIARHSQSVAGD